MSHDDSVADAVDRLLESDDNIEYSDGEGSGPYQFQGRGDTIRGIFGVIGDAIGDLVGALTTPGRGRPVPARGFVKVTTPGGRQINALLVGHRKSSRSSYQTAVEIGNRSIKIAAELRAAAKRKPGPGAKLRVPPARLTALAAKVARGGQSVLTAAQKFAVQAAAAEAKRNAALGRVPAAMRKVSSTALARPSAVRPSASTALRPRVSTALRPRVVGLSGDEYETVLGNGPNFYEFIGGGSFRDILGATPDPNKPGYNTDGTIDWSWSSDGTPTGYNPDGSPSDGSAPAGGDYPAGYDPASELASLTPPTMEDAALKPGEYIPDPGYEGDGRVYDSTKGDLPLNFVPYDGSHGWPADGFTSYARAAAGAGDKQGYYWDGTKWMLRFYWDDPGAQMLDYPVSNGSPSLIERYPFSLEQMSKDRVLSSNKHIAQPWVLGPLVGNWAGNGLPTWVKGLRWDYGGKKWFWYYDKAPKWATDPGDQERLAALILLYKAQVEALKAAAAAKVMADIADKKAADVQQRSWALEDAATQHRMDAEDLEMQHQQAMQDAGFGYADQQGSAPDAGYGGGYQPPPGGGGPFDDLYPADAGQAQPQGATDMEAALLQAHAAKNLPRDASAFDDLDEPGDQDDGFGEPTDDAAELELDARLR